MTALAFARESRRRRDERAARRRTSPTRRTRRSRAARASSASGPTRFACCRSATTCRLAPGRSPRGRRRPRAGRMPFARLARTAARRTPARSTRLPSSPRSATRTGSGFTWTPPTAGSPCSRNAAARARRDRARRLGHARPAQVALPAVRVRLPARPRRPRCCGARSRSRPPTSTTPSPMTDEVNFADLGMQLDAHVARAQGLALDLRTSGSTRSATAIDRCLDLAERARRAHRVESPDARARSSRLARGGLLPPPLRRRRRGRRIVRNAALVSRLERQRPRARLLDASRAAGTCCACASSATRHSRSTSSACSTSSSTPSVAAAPTAQTYERHPDVGRSWLAGAASGVGRPRESADLPLAARRRSWSGSVRGVTSFDDVARGETIVAQWEASKDFYVVLAGAVGRAASAPSASAARAGRLLRRAGGARLGERLRLPAPGDRGRSVRRAAAARPVRRAERAGARELRARARDRPCRARAVAHHRQVIDPLERWRDLGDKPDYAGLLTFGVCRTRRTQRSSTASTSRSSARRPTTSSRTVPARASRRARSARRAARRGRISRPASTRRSCAIVDFGDAAVIPADPARTHAAIERHRRRGRRGGRRPDRSRRRPLDRRAGHPRVRGASRPGRPRPLRHAHRHRDARSSESSARTARRCTGWSRHGTSTRGATCRSGCAATGPASASSRWQHERGITSFFMHDVRELGIDAVVERAIAAVGDGPVFLSVDVDVLDPAFAPGTGTPEPGGMTTRRSPPRVPRARRAARPRRRGGGRGDPDGGRLGRRDGARRRADRPRDPHRYGAAQGRLIRRARLSTTCRPRSPRMRSGRRARG